MRGQTTTRQTHSVLEVFIQYFLCAMCFLDTWDIAVNKNCTHGACILVCWGVWSSGKQYKNRQVCQMVRNVIEESKAGKNRELLVGWEAICTKMGGREELCREVLERLSRWKEPEKGSAG